MTRTRALAACLSSSVVALSLVSASASAITFASDKRDLQRESFRAGAVYVEVPAMVANKDGTFVPNLTAADFELREDGDVQDVASVSLPVESRVYLMILDDLQTDPQDTDRMRRAARQFVEQFLAPDDVLALIFTSGAEAGFAEFSVDRREALRAIDAFNGLKESSAAKQDDRSSGGDFPEYRDARSGQVLRGLPGQTIGIRERLRGSGTDKSPFDARAASRALQSITTLARLAEAMGQVALPRRPIIYLTPGLEYDDSDVTDETSLYVSQIRNTLQKAIKVATRGNVSVYAIDPRGGVFGEVGGGRRSAALQRSADSLRRLASETGGFAAIATNDFTQTFARVVRENSQYYVLGYYPAKPRTDGRFHKLTVTVRGRADLTVIARKGYWADSKREARDRLAAIAPPPPATPGTPGAPGTPAGPETPAAHATPDASAASVRPPAADSASSETAAAAAAAAAAAPVIVASAPARDESASTVDSVEMPSQLMSQLVDMLGSAQGTRGLPLRLSTLAFVPKDRKIAIFADVKLLGAVPLQTRQDRRFTANIGTAYAAIDESGRIVSNGQGVLKFNLSPDEAEHMKTTGFRWMSHFDVEPGTYQIRIAAAEAVEGRKGSLIVDIDVPDYRADVAMSCMLVRSPTAARAGIGGWQLDTLARKMSSTRVFSRDDMLVAAAEVHERKPQPTQITTRILTADRRELLVLDQTFALDELLYGRYVSYRILPLASLAPGRYILQFTARTLGSPARESQSPAGSRASAGSRSATAPEAQSRELAFTIAADRCDGDTPDTPRYAGGRTSGAPCGSPARGVTR